VLVAGYLGAQAYVTKGLADTARITANETSRDVKQRQSIHDKTVEIVGDPNNGIVGRDNELAEIATELEVRAAAGATLLAVDRALRNSMPADLWITKQTMKIDRDQTPGLGAREVARPILHITGRGREGAMQIEEAFRTFMARLTETLGVAPVVGQAKSSSKGFDFQIHLNLVPIAAPAASAEGGK
jgi:hypothetical protein